MKHTYWLSGLAVPFCLPQQAIAEKQPHIIFIMTDQQRGDAIGCAGNDRIITPNIDTLAQDGFLFNNAYSATPSSTPARAGLLTGLSPWHHGMLGYGNVAEHYKFEMPQMLRDTATSRWASARCTGALKTPCTVFMPPSSTKADG